MPGAPSTDHIMVRSTSSWNNGTKVTVDLAVQDVNFLGRLAEPLIVRTARRHVQHSLETLKDLLELHGPNHPR
jgi:hypothetical protein